MLREVYYLWRVCLPFSKSRNIDYCPHCKAERIIFNDVKRIGDLRKRIEANDAVAVYVLGGYCNNGKYGFLEDREKAIELWTQAAALGSSHAHYSLGFYYEGGGDLKKAKFHYEAATIAIISTIHVN